MNLKNALAATAPKKATAQSKLVRARTGITAGLQVDKTDFIVARPRLRRLG